MSPPLNTRVALIYLQPSLVTTAKNVDIHCFFHLTESINVSINGRDFLSV